MKRQVREIGVERLNPRLQDVNVVFTTLDNAVDLLQYVYWPKMFGNIRPLNFHIFYSCFVDTVRIDRSTYASLTMHHCVQKPNSCRYSV